jgi:hypothetical protein
VVGVHPAIAAVVAKIIIRPANITAKERMAISSLPGLGAPGSSPQARSHRKRSSDTRAILPQDEPVVGGGWIDADRLKSVGRMAAGRMYVPWAGLLPSAPKNQTIDIHKCRKSGSVRKASAEYGAMHLTVVNLAHYLINRGLLSADAVVAADLVILDASRRNRNFKVIRKSGPGLFVKQMRETQPDTVHTLRREAACYERARNDPTLNRLMPQLIAYDRVRHLLIIELLPEAESLAEHHARERTFPVEIGRMLGEALGLYHGCAASIIEDESMSSLFPRQVPPVLRLQRGGLAALGQFGRVGPAVSAVIQQHSEFQNLLDELGAEWRFDSLIHGDLKWDNVLVFPALDGGLDFRVVDWELADFGDPAWDVGAVLQSFLSVWVLSMPITSGLPPEHYVGMAEQPIEPMRPVMRAFWEAYAAVRGFADAERERALERSMRFAAARLLWTAAEQRVHAAQLDLPAMALLEVSLNILKSPAQAVTDLIDG